MYVLGTCVPDFQNWLHLRCPVHYVAEHRYQSNETKPSNVYGTSIPADNCDANMLRSKSSLSKPAF